MVFSAILPHCLRAREGSGSNRGFKHEGTHGPSRRVIEARGSKINMKLAHIFDMRRKDREGNRI